MAKTTRKKFNISFICNDGDGELETVNGTTSTFKCPDCGLLMKYLEKERKLGAHGRTVDSLNHELRNVVEL